MRVAGPGRSKRLSGCFVSVRHKDSLTCMNLALWPSERFRRDQSLHLLIGLLTHLSPSESASLSRPDGSIYLPSSLVGTKSPASMLQVSLPPCLLTSCPVPPPASSFIVPSQRQGGSDLGVGPEVTLLRVPQPRATGSSGKAHAFIRDRGKLLITLLDVCLGWM